MAGPREPTIRTTPPKKRITLDVLDDGRVAVLVTKRGEENAMGFTLREGESSELLEQLRAIWRIE
jgi:hypothetical protein